jgi:ankyrin repeat protein
MARLYLDTLLNKTTRRKIKAALETLPGGLDSIYEELIVRVKLQNPKDHAELAVKVLGWIFYAARPLTVTEVQHALAIEQGDTDLDEDGIPNRDLLVSVCCGMVMINDSSSTVSLVHYTAQEYFQRSGIRLLDHANRDIASACLTYLQFDSFNREIMDSSSQETVPILLRDYPLVVYAAQHWGNHLRQAADQHAIDQAVELLEDDAKVHIISWIRDYMESQAKGTCFRPRTHVQGLALASSFGLTDVASSLIEVGSRVGEKDSEGQTALHRATANGYPDTVARLLDLGAEVNSKDAIGWSPLHQASARSDEGTAKLLIERGANVDAVDGYNPTPLYRAAESGAERIAKLLLLRRADVHVTNSYFQTVLHRAADNGHVSVVDILLRHGADPTAKDHYGYTPFYRAADQGQEDVTRLLQSRTIS